VNGEGEREKACIQNHPDYGLQSHYYCSKNVNNNISFPVGETLYMGLQLTQNILIPENSFLSRPSSRTHVTCPYVDIVYKKSFRPYGTVRFFLVLIFL
jgi:hypothetical protein